MEWENFQRYYAKTFYVSILEMKNNKESQLYYRK